MKQRAVPIGILLVCVYWLYCGIFQYGLWVDDGPGGGFMPVFAAVLSAFFAILLLWKPDIQKFQINLGAFTPAALIIAAVILSYLLGLLPALGLMAFFWLKVKEDYSLGKALLLTCLIMAIVWGVFSLWLAVPFPAGWFADNVLS